MSAPPVVDLEYLYISRRMSTAHAQLNLTLKRREEEKREKKLHQMSQGTELITPATGEKKYKGVRRRQWGKWVSEIRVPGSKERLWLGSYATPEAAAVAHDTAVFFLKGPGPLPAENLNFPDRVAAAYAWAPLSPHSVQRVASDAGMSLDARVIDRQQRNRGMSDVGPSDGCGSGSAKFGNQFENFERGEFGMDHYLYVDETEIYR